MFTFAIKEKDFISVPVNDTKTVFKLPAGSYYLNITEHPTLEKQKSSIVPIRTDMGSFNETIQSTINIITNKKILSKRNNTLITGGANSGKTLIADIIANASIKEGKVVLRITQYIGADLLRYVLTTIKQPVLVILDNIVDDNDQHLYLELLSILTDSSLSNISFVVMIRSIPTIGKISGMDRVGRFQFNINTDIIKSSANFMASRLIPDIPISKIDMLNKALKDKCTFSMLQSALRLTPVNWQQVLITIELDFSEWAEYKIVLIPKKEVQSGWSSYTCDIRDLMITDYASSIQKLLPKGNMIMERKDFQKDNENLGPIHLELNHTLNGVAYIIHQFTIQSDKSKVVINQIVDTKTLH